jgi:hypothetical protein
MAEVVVNSTSPTNNSQLMALLNAESIEPGDEAGYQLCKQLWVYHPLASKIIEKPVRLALSKKRTIIVDCPLKERVIEAFEKEWEKLGATNYIRDVMFLTRVYGAAAIVYGSKDSPTDKPIDPWKLWKKEIYFNTYDPLNLAGSIVTNQNPNAPDFQKPWSYITAAGQPYHPSRTQVMFNSTPIYLEYQSSGFRIHRTINLSTSVIPFEIFYSIHGNR